MSASATTAADGARQSTAVAFLHLALDHPNFTATTRATAQRLLFKDDRCVGVEYLHDGEVKQARAEIEVVVSSGTIGSAQLLMLSGIGNAEDLRGLGIEVVSHLPGVGQNLHDHLLLGVIFEARQQIPEPNNNLLEAQMFAKSDSRLLGPDLQPLFMHLPYYVPGFEGPENAYTLAAGLIRPVSRGFTKLRSSDPWEPPVLDPRYLSEIVDVERLLVSVKTCQKLGNTSAFDDWNAGREVFPGPEATSDDDLKSYIRRAVATYHHQVGTCKMGIDGMAVVDPGLRVYGVERLRVADASMMMPSVTSGNNNAPTVMIGEKAADMIGRPKESRARRARS